MPSDMLCIRDIASDKLKYVMYSNNSAFSQLLLCKANGQDILIGNLLPCTCSAQLLLLICKVALLSSSQLIKNIQRLS